MIFYPVGDAKKYQGVSVKTNPFFFCGEILPHTLPHRFDKVFEKNLRLSKSVGQIFG